MDFVAKEDIEAPIDAVFAILSDVDAIERQALRRGVDVRRTTPHQLPIAGMAWQAEFAFRGRKRVSEIELSEFDRPQLMVFDSKTGGLNTQFKLDLMQLTTSVTRVTSTAELSATTLSARLLVQSMKLAKSRIQRRYAVRMAQFAREVEERATKLA